MKYKNSIFNEYFNYSGKNYVFNTSSGSLIQMDRDYPLRATKEELAVLLDNGVIVRDTTDEVFELIEKVNRKIDAPIKTLYITVVLTNNCNFGCVYCYQNHCHKDFSVEDATRLTAQVDEWLGGDIESIVVNYFGGEPLMNSDILINLDSSIKSIARKYSKGYQSNISTNGSMLSVDILQKVQFNLIRLTFDGNALWHNRFRKMPAFSYANQVDLLDCILKNSNSKVEVRFNVCKENTKSFDNVFDDILGISSFDASRVKFEVARMKNVKNNSAISELTQEEYARAYMTILTYKKNHNLRLNLPKPATTPCPFSINKAVCLGPGMIKYFCSESDGKSIDKDLLSSRRPHISLSRDCQECKCLPFCLGPCRVHKQSNSSCIPEKYILPELLTAFLS